jgi:hypothetical protein
VLVRRGGEGQENQGANITTTRSTAMRFMIIVKSTPEIEVEPSPVSDENHAYIHRVLDNAFAFHGRVASREQVQIEISFPHHQMWFELFLGWWEYGFRSWRRRAGPDENCSFVCELGPKPYAITGRDGNDLSDRWDDALLMRGKVRALWDRLAAEG